MPNSRQRPFQIGDLPQPPRTVRRLAQPLTPAPGEWLQTAISRWAFDFYKCSRRDLLEALGVSTLHQVEIRGRGVALRPETAETISAASGIPFVQLYAMTQAMRDRATWDEFTYVLREGHAFPFRERDLIHVPLFREVVHNVRGHATNAKSFGVFIASMADASKEYVKSMLRLGSMSAPLRVAPGPGSVRATFIAPRPHERADERHTPLTAGTSDDRVWTESDVYSDSLWAIATVFSNAEPDPDSAALDGIIQSIPFRARTQLRKVAEQVAARDWQINGEFRKQGLQSHGVSLSSRGAKHLAEQLAVQDVHRTQWNTSGAITGHRWDKGLMFFAADDRTRTFAASFESSDLEQRVAQLATVEDRRVEARFTIYTSVGRGADEGRRSYVLEAIYPTVADSELDLPIADRPV